MKQAAILWTFICACCMTGSAQAQLNITARASDWSEGCAPETAMIRWVYMESEGWTEGIVEGPTGFPSCYSFIWDHESLGTDPIPTYALVEELRVTLETGVNQSIEMDIHYVDYPTLPVQLPPWTFHGCEEMSVDLDASRVAGAFTLEQNHPNPFNPATTIRFTLSQATHARLDVFNLLGRTIVTLVDETLRAGSHEVRFDASGLPSGVYLYRLEVAGHSLVRRMVLNK